MDWDNTAPEDTLRYYEQEFGNYLGSLPQFLLDGKPKQVALVLEQPYPTIGDSIPDRDFIRRDTFSETHGGKELRPNFAGWDGRNSIAEFIKSPAEQDPLDGDAELADPDVVGRPAIPGAVYYSLDFHDRNWILAVDIDAKDVALEEARDSLTSESLSDKKAREKYGVIDAPPEGFKYRFKDIRKALKLGFEIEEFFKSALGAEQTLVVYSGQGCHVYLYDDEPEYRYDTRARRFVSDHLEEKLNIPIDRQVTTDSSRVLRLPYSLHTGVGRVVTPIESPRFDFKEEAIPETLERQRTETETIESEADS